MLYMFIDNRLYLLQYKYDCFLPTFLIVVSFSVDAIGVPLALLHFGMLDRRGGRRKNSQTPNQSLVFNIHISSLQVYLQLEQKYDCQTW